MTEKIPVTVEILTHNSASTLRRALDSVGDCAEILIIDGNSTDETRAIAEAYGARVLEQDTQFLNNDGTVSDFSGVRNQGLSAASYDWFFFLDSDEEASPELVSRIADCITEGQNDAYWVNRQYVYRDRVITCSASYPNRQMRLFKRSGLGIFTKKIHERISTLPETRIAIINEPILVPTLESGEMLERKMFHYRDLEVRRLSAIGKSALLSGMFGGVKNALGFGIRFVRSWLTCRGQRLPLSDEFRPLRYQISLSLHCFLMLCRI